MELIKDSGEVLVDLIKIYYNNHYYLNFVPTFIIEKVEIAMSSRKHSLSLHGVLIIALVAMIILLLLWHLFWPVFGIALAITAVTWGVLLATSVLVAVGVLLFYLFSGIGILIICGSAFLWFIGALVMFPVLFPFLVPLLILLLFIGYARRREKGN